MLFLLSQNSQRKGKTNVKLTILHNASPFISSGFYHLRQRGLNDLQRTKLSSWSYDSAPRPPPSPPLPFSKLYLFLSLPVCHRSRLLTGGGEGAGVEPNHTTAGKLGLL
jgi:hypothetical protein